MERSRETMGREISFDVTAQGFSKSTFFLKKYTRLAVNLVKTM